MHREKLEEVEKRIETGQKREHHPEAHFRFLVENTCVLFCILDRAGWFTYASPGFKSITGHNPEDLVGRNSRLYCHPDDLERLAAVRARLLDGQPVLNLKCRFRHRDGRYLTLIANWEPHFDAAGQVVGSACVAHDVTALEAAEEALRRSEARYRTTFENTGTAMAVVEEDGTISLANRRFEALSGYPRAEIEGKKSWTEFVVPEDRERMRGYHYERRCPGGKAPTEYEFRFVNRRGEVRDILLNIQVIPGTKQSVCSLTDITERKRVEEALRKSEERFRLLAENARGIVYRLQLVPERRFEYVSPATTAIIGYTPEEYYQDPHLDYKLVHADDRHLLADLVSGKIDGTEPLVLRWVRRDGRVIWVEQHNVPIYDAGGNLVAIEGVAWDITERKKMEERLEYFSLHDPLTGLYNRAYFEEEMRRLDIKRYGPVSLIVGDLNGLKLINDTLGHAVGDEFLQAAAAALRESFRPGDCVARIGGDEFAVLLPRTGAAAARRARDRIRKNVARFNATRQHVFPLSISLGLTTGEGAAVNLTELFKEADNNMYREKLLNETSTHNAVTQALAAALEARDFFTEGHAERLRQMVSDFGRALELPDRSLADLALLAHFHDVGKVGIPDRILLKSGPLTPEERAEMQRHCEIGHRIAQSTNQLAQIADLILKHQEWWNGEGYPLGLKGEEIPLECRILAIVDAWDAMTSDRLYRKAMPAEAAAAELQRCAGTQFDPQLVPRFLRLMRAK
jgi:diguanylate cyclase (GGDEF)-like protein/PAS domain S-box-containing protein